MINMYFSLTGLPVQEVASGLGYKNVTLLVILHHPGKERCSRRRTTSFSQAPAWGHTTWSVQCSFSCVPSAWRYHHVQTVTCGTGEAAWPAAIRVGLSGPQTSDLAYFFLRNDLWFGFLIWAEPALLKASFGNVGGNGMHIISLAWQKHLTRCLVKA